MVWVFDCLNFVGWLVEGLMLCEGWESFVGVGLMFMWYGFIVGEFGYWFICLFNLDVDYRVIKMEGWEVEEFFGFGWLFGMWIWVNFSLNVLNFWMVWVYVGIVMLEGIMFFEGWGIICFFEFFGVLDIDVCEVICLMMELVFSWFEGC